MKGIKDMLIKNLSTGLKSYAVWLPTALTIIVAILDIAMDTQLIPVAWIPVVVFVSGYLGRIIKQPTLKE